MTDLNDEFGLGEVEAAAEGPSAGVKGHITAPKVSDADIKKQRKSKKKDEKPKFYTIVIDQVDGQPSYETVGVYGKQAPNKTWQIERGVPVKVPACVVEVLTNAVAGKVIVLPEGGFQVTDYNLVPFRIMGME